MRPQRGSSDNHAAQPTRHLARSPKAVGLLAAQVGANLALWIPLPIGVLWVASQLEYQTDSLFLGALAGFALLFAGISVGLRVVRRIDAAWLTASVQPWRESALTYIASACAVVGGGGFGFWLLVIGGMQSSIFPSN